MRLAMTVPASAQPTIMSTTCARRNAFVNPYQSGLTVNKPIVLNTIVTFVLCLTRGALLGRVGLAARQRTDRSETERVSSSARRVSQSAISWLIHS